MEKLDYFTKQTDTKLFQDLEWNVPEQKTGVISIIGGNSENFSTIIHSAEKLTSTYPLKTVNLLLPESLKSKLPPLPGLIFLPATDSGSIAKSSVLNDYIGSSDFALFLGDFSKNSETSIAISDALKNTSAPALITRDTIDLILPEMPDLIERDHLFIMGSLAQMQKLFRAVYYPKVLLLSMPLIPVVEALHKFTLSYHCTILTLHAEQIIVAHHGKVISVPLQDTSYSPISIWNGELASKIAANNLFSKGQPLEATIFSIS